MSLYFYFGFAGGSRFMSPSADWTLANWMPNSN